MAAGLDGTGTGQNGNFSMAGGGGIIATANGAFYDWQNGWLYGLLTITNGAQARFSSANAKSLADSAELRNYGTITWTGGPILILRPGQPARRARDSSRRSTGAKLAVVPVDSAGQAVAGRANEQSVTRQQNSISCWAPS